MHVAWSQQGYGMRSRILHIKFKYPVTHVDESLKTKVKNLVFKNFACS